MEREMRAQACLQSPRRLPRWSAVPGKIAALVSLGEAAGSPQKALAPLSPLPVVPVRCPRRPAFGGRLQSSPRSGISSRSSGETRGRRRRLFRKDPVGQTSSTGASPPPRTPPSTHPAALSPPFHLFPSPSISPLLPRRLPRCSPLPYHAPPPPPPPPPPPTPLQLLRP
ncbi:hypothetical protein EX30DRAFT_136851 [Ascodesmis nigricans]|uniref:Uncharacterized protein n=1 Tax=Ascodesmis nigricans TaxID=341454 RepID=A0A4S2MN86_9PEZI|nr:hypothetical protein EX30DRAFT_136851 [Ascodesmis nigricans]